jgi:hypothetical protein
MNAIRVPYWSNSSTAFPTIAINALNRKAYPGSTLSYIAHVNWNYYQWYQPCQFWYEEGYKEEDFYSQPPMSAGKTIRDTTFIAQPLGGWLPNIIDYYNITSPTRYLTNGTTVQFWQMWYINFNSSKAAKHRNFHWICFKYLFN